MMVNYFKFEASVRSRPASMFCEDLVIWFASTVQILTPLIASSFQDHKDKVNYKEMPSSNNATEHKNTLQNLFSGFTTHSHSLHSLHTLYQSGFNSPYWVYHFSHEHPALTSTNVKKGSVFVCYTWYNLRKQVTQKALNLKPNLEGCV